MITTKIIPFALLYCVSFTSVFGQVKQAKIGDNPGVMSAPSSTVLELESTNKALLISRVASTASITNPVNGMIVYDIAARCVRLFQKGLWLDCGLTTANIVSGTGKVWMDRDLGAARVATSTTDFLAYGSLYQWGRRADGHQLINWTNSTTGVAVSGVTGTTSSTDTPANNLFIFSASDWRTTKNDALWQGVSGTNNPCPSGFRIPTSAELQAEMTAYNMASGNPTTYNSVFKFPLSGLRNGDNGSMLATGTGINFYIWSSTVSGNDVFIMSVVGSTGTIGSTKRSHGLSVRCIQN